MPAELTLHERLAWVWETVGTLASLFDMDDDDLTYTVFEPLDIDVWSALSEENLTTLMGADLVPKAVARKLIAVRATVSSLIQEAHERKDYMASSIRQSVHWARIIGVCRNLLENRSAQG
jgi:hypothetical protein